MPGVCLIVSIMFFDQCVQFNVVLIVCVPMVVLQRIGKHSNNPMIRVRVRATFTRSSSCRCCDPEHGAIEENCGFLRCVVLLKYEST